MAEAPKMIVDVGPNEAGAMTNPLRQAARVADA